MGKISRDRGLRFEREIVNLHKALGVPCERVPLSGSMKGNYAADLRIGPGLAMTCECKLRKRAWQDLYDAVAQDEADILFIRRDRSAPLVVLPWITWADLLGRLGWIDADRATLLLPANQPNTEDEA